GDRSIDNRQAITLRMGYLHPAKLADNREFFNNERGAFSQFCFNKTMSMQPTGIYTAGDALDLQ
ncbi:MAG: hypothetical protein ACAH89_10195, partial [Rariglobus sp.]